MGFWELLRDLVAKLTGRLLAWAIVDEWEAGVRLRLGRTQADVGPGWVWKWPLIDVVETMPSKWRVIATAPQTLDRTTYSFGVRYRVASARKVYENVHDPSATLHDEVRSVIGEMEGNLAYTAPDALVEEALEEIQVTAAEWGLEVDAVRVIDRTDANALRLIQDAATFGSDGSEE